MLLSQGEPHLFIEYLLSHGEVGYKVHLLDRATSQLLWFLVLWLPWLWPLGS